MYTLFSDHEIIKGGSRMQIKNKWKEKRKGRERRGKERKGEKMEEEKSQRNFLRNVCSLCSKQ